MTHMNTTGRREKKGIEMKKTNKLAKIRQEEEIHQEENEVKMAEAGRSVMKDVTHHLLITLFSHTLTWTLITRPQVHGAIKT